MFDGMTMVDFYWLMFIIRFSLSFGIFYRYGPIGSEDYRKEFINSAGKESPLNLMISVYLTMLISASLWYLTLPYTAYEIIRFGLPEPRK